MTLTAGSPAIAGDLETDLETVVDDAIAALTWTTWTPTLTNLTQGSGTLTANYFRIGNLVLWNFRFVLGAGSAVGTVPTFTLPAAPATRYNTLAVPVGSAYMLDSGTGRWEGVVFSSTGSSAAIYYATEAGGGSGTNITSTAPFTWTSPDELTAWGFYEAAA